MKLFKKIDLFYSGDYVCSTNQSRTCKGAIERYLERLRYLGEARITLVQLQILKNPKQLKAFFDKQ